MSAIIFFPSWKEPPGPSLGHTPLNGCFASFQQSSKCLNQEKRKGFHVWRKMIRSSMIFMKYQEISPNIKKRLLLHLYRGVLSNDNRRNMRKANNFKQGLQAEQFTVRNHMAQMLKREGLLVSIQECQRKKVPHQDKRTQRIRCFLSSALHE